MLLAITGCQVNTQIDVEATGPGHGVVSVTVSLDPAAVAAVGGSSALAAQLQDADLIAAGWAVTGPQAGPRSSTVVSASHAYAAPAQASALVAELAGDSGAGGIRPFRLSFSDRHSFWRTDTVLSGEVDLTCGLDCFGDSALKSALGFPTGLNPGPLSTAAGQQADQVFTFSLAAGLQGSLVRSNADARQGDTLRWTPRLGQKLELLAVTRSWNWARIVGSAIGAGVVVLGLVVLVALLWRRRRRRRKQGSGQPSGSTQSGRRRRGGLHRKPRDGAGEAVSGPP
jgi:hypothetical protein